MNRTITILTIGLQVVLTFTATFSIYMVFALLDSDFGFDGLFGLFIIQPVFAVVLSLLTIIACSIVGLPIRLSNKINHWWTTHFYIAILSAVFGLTLLTLAFVPGLQQTATITLDGQQTVKHIPNATLSYIGWFVTAFSLLHIYPPRQLTDKIKNLLPTN